MVQKSETNPPKLNQATLALIGVLLAFVLALVFIWMWYDTKDHSLEKQEPGTTQSIR